MYNWLSRGSYQKDYTSSYIEQLRKNDDSLRLKALSGLRNMADMFDISEAIPHIIQAIVDEHPQVRNAAKKTLDTALRTRENQEETLIHLINAVGDLKGKIVDVCFSLLVANAKGIRLEVDLDRMRKTIADVVERHNSRRILNIFPYRPMPLGIAMVKISAAILKVGQGDKLDGILLKDKPKPPARDKRKLVRMRRVHV